MLSRDSECDWAASAIVHMSASTQFDVVLINALRVIKLVHLPRQWRQRRVIWMYRGIVLEEDLEQWSVTDNYVMVTVAW